MKKTFLNLPRGIWILGLTGFLINLSTIMVFSVMPVFMKIELGASEHLIGSIDGFVEFISYIMRIVSGSVSDIIQNRKIILGTGYTLSTLVKPLFALSSSVGFIILIRAFDRVTNGLQASPRDALIGDLSPADKRGASYGLSKSLKTAGSVVGAILAVWIMTVSYNNFRLLFLCAFFPALIALILFVFGVKEPKHAAKPLLQEVPSPTDKAKKKRIHWKSFLELKSGYWRIIALVGFYELAHFGESYLTFRAQEVGIKVAHISFVMMWFNLGQFFLSYPIGLLSDRFKRPNILMGGFVFLIAANICLMAATSPWLIYVGVFCWGAQIGTSQSIFVAMIADETPQYLRGTAFGILYVIMGLDILFASKMAGILWDLGSSTNIFIYSITICLLSIVWLWRIRHTLDNRQPT